MKYTVYGFLIIFLSCNKTPNTTKRSTKTAIVQKHIEHSVKTVNIKNMKNMEFTLMINPRT